MTEHVTLKVASANLNQTVMNYTRNVPNIKAAIDKAVEDGADVLSLQELGLTGYSGEDNFKWIHAARQQKEIVDLAQDIADYAASKNPNLVISLGLPLFYADKTQEVKINVGTEEAPAYVDNPLYNIHDRPFNAVATISGGKIQAISAKSIQPDGPAEYEPRQFTSWPDYLGVKQITLANGQTVPFGKVVVQLGKGDTHCSLYHEICAEGWPGLADDGSINHKEQEEARYLNLLAKQQDISLVINPSASKPEAFLDKPQLRRQLCETGSKTTGGGYVYTNTLGLEAAPAAFEGGSLFANKGELTHRGKRYSMADVVYSSAPITVPVPKRAKPDVVIDHEFAQEKAAAVGGPSAWEEAKGNAREAEEVVRNTALWIRDYLKKTELQGFVVSLSGGADSAFGAVMISEAIDLNLHELEEKWGSKEKAVAEFINQFSHLNYHDAVLEALAAHGADAAISLLKKSMLTCIYLPSDNSGVTTQDAARTLIEGGKLVTVDLGDGTQTTVVLNEAHGDRLENGTLFKVQSDQSVKEYAALDAPKQVAGIGGKFEVVNVQNSVDSYIEAFAGLVHKDVRDKLIDDPDHPGEKIEFLPRAQQEIREFVTGKRIDFSSAVDAVLNKDPARRLTWKNPSHDITLQNIQARARQPYPWMFGNQEHKIACVTSNWSEAVAGYWTFGGDGHMGAINLCGGVPKSKLRRILRYLEQDGLTGMPRVEALNPVNVQIPTAELRPTAQSDEADMMPYTMLDAIGLEIFYQKKTPLEAYKALQTVRNPDDESRLLFATHEDPEVVDKEYLITCIEKACTMWRRSQFKRIGSVISPFLGENADPHTSIRTTILSDLLPNGVAELKLEYLKERLGSEAAVAEKMGMPFANISLKAKNDYGIREALNNTPVRALEAAIEKPDFGKSEAKSIFVA